MKNSLRMFEAKKFENKPLDKAISFVHDVFFTPVLPAIGTSFVSFVGASLILFATFITYDTLQYMNFLVR